MAIVTQDRKFHGSCLCQQGLPSSLKGLVLLTIPFKTRDMVEKRFSVENSHVKTQTEILWLVVCLAHTSNAREPRPSFPPRPEAALLGPRFHSEAGATHAHREEEEEEFHSLPPATTIAGSLDKRGDEEAEEEPTIITAEIGGAEEGNDWGMRGGRSRGVGKGSDRERQGQQEKQCLGNCRCDVPL